MAVTTRAVAVTAWRPLASRGDFPLILAGPIVRRVEPGSATVFVALSDHDTVTLTVLDASGAVVAASGGQPTVALGDGLHVLAATALPAGGTALAPGNIYTYRLEFASVQLSGNDNFAAALGDPGLSQIVYPGQTLPSFCLPPQDLSLLRIVHTSCRKAHGETVDALPIVDQLLAEAVAGAGADPTVGRPQQLYLTGDQTYSDDVCDAMLAMCVDAAGYLLGSRKEPHPRRVGFLSPGDWTWLDLMNLDEYALPQGTTLPWPNPPTGAWPGVGQRGLHVYAAGYTVTNPQSTSTRELAALAGAGKTFAINPYADTQEERTLAEAFKEFFKYQLAANHLMMLGEFYAMLLLSWSPALWDDPSAAARTPLPFYDDLDGSSWATGHTAADGFTAAAISARGIAADRLRAFRQGIPAVRRALANVATYMVFDDHDVTDDWFLNREWCTRVLRVSGDTLGRRMIRNALISYAVFQAWGNTPDRFIRGSASTPGGALLDALDAGEEMTTDLAALENLAADQACISNLVGVPWSLPDTTAAEATTAVVRSPRSLTWHYRWGPVSWQFEVLVTDCRTVRGYELRGLAAPVLLDDGGTTRPNQIRAQIPAPDHTLDDEYVTLVVVQTPVLGVRALEAFQRATIELPWTAQVFGTDAESWLSKRGREGLIARLMEHNPRSVILSGDVHYAFAMCGDYYATRPYGASAALSAPRTGRLIQLVSSSARNEIGKTRAAVEWADRLPGVRTVSGRAEVPSFPLTYKPPSVEEIYGAPFVIGTESWDTAFDQAEWTLDLQRIRSISSTIPPLPPTQNPMVWVGQHLASELRRPARPRVVGVNNVATITIAGSDRITRAVQQRVYTRSDDLAHPTVPSNDFLYVVPLVHVDG